MTTARIMLHRQSTEPTERSIPPVIITIVMPSDMIATKVKLRVMLKRLLGVAKELVANVRKMHAAMSDLLKREAIRKAIADAGALVQPTTTEQFRQYIGAEIARWRRVRDRAGIQPQT